MQDKIRAFAPVAPGQLVALYVTKENGLWRLPVVGFATMRERGEGGKFDYIEPVVLPEATHVDEYVSAMLLLASEVDGFAGVYVVKELDDYGLEEIRLNRLAIIEARAEADAEQEEAERKAHGLEG